MTKLYPVMKEFFTYI